MPYNDNPQTQDWENKFEKILMEAPNCDGDIEWKEMEKIMQFVHDLLAQRTREVVSAFDGMEETMHHEFIEEQKKILKHFNVDV